MLLGRYISTHKNLPKIPELFSQNLWKYRNLQAKSEGKPSRKNFLPENSFMSGKMCIFAAQIRANRNK